jgi:hypothetical protein
MIDLNDNLMSGFRSLLENFLPYIRWRPATTTGIGKKYSSPIPQAAYRESRKPN